MNNTVVRFDKQKKLLQNLLNLITFQCGRFDNLSRIMKAAYFVILSTVLCFITVGRIVSFANISDPFDKLTVGMQISFMFGGLLWLVNFQYIKPEVIEIVSAFDEHSLNYLGVEAMKIVCDNFFFFLKDISRLFGLSIILNWIATLAVKQDDAGSYEFMDFYSCGSMDKQPPVKFCIKRGSIWYNLVKVVLNPAWNCLEISVGLGLWLAYILLTYSIETRLIMYKNKLGVFINELKTNKKYRISNEAKFFLIIKYQQDILRKSRNIIRIINIPMVGHVMMFYLYALFGILALSQHEFKSTYLILKLSIPTFFIVYIHYSCCKNTYILGHVHDNIIDMLLDLPWYEQNLSFQKCYLNLIVVTRKNHPLYICGLYEMDLRFFTANIKNLYTLTNLLLLKFKS